MRTLLVSLSLLIVSASAFAASPASGRWRGAVRIPGEELTLVVDLEQDPAGAWHGSVTIPGLNLAAATLSDISTAAGKVSFSIPSALGAPPVGPATFSGEVRASTLTGTFSLAGNRAPFALTREGAAQVERPPESTAVDAALEGTWQGDYQLAGYAHHVTLGFANHPGTAAKVEFLLVGKQPHTLSVDLVTQYEGLLRVESRDLAVNFEGRLNAATGELAGVVEQGPFEAPIVMRRVSAGAQ